MTTTKKPWIFTPLNALRAANGVLKGNRTLTPEQRKEFVGYCVEDMLNCDASYQSRADIYRRGFKGFEQHSDAELAQAYLDACEGEDFDVAITLPFHLSSITDQDLRGDLDREISFWGYQHSTLLIKVGVIVTNGALESYACRHTSLGTATFIQGICEDLAIRAEEYYAEQIKAAVEELLGGWDDE